MWSQLLAEPDSRGINHHLCHCGLSCLGIFQCLGCGLPASSWVPHAFCALLPSACSPGGRPPSRPDLPADSVWLIWKLFLLLMSVFFLPLSSKMLNECFPCSSEAGVCPCVSATAIHSGLCGCRDQLTRVEAAGAAPSHTGSSHQGVQDPGRCWANTRTLGFWGEPWDCGLLDP